MERGRSECGALSRIRAGRPDSAVRVWYAHGVVLAFLSVEVGDVIIVTAAVLGTKALLLSQGFDQRPFTEKCSFAAAACPVGDSEAW